MVNLVRLWLLLFTLYLLVNACAAQSNAHPKHFKVSHFHHPEIATFKQLIKDTYAQLNIEVVFTELPAARGLIQLNKGQFDADIVRLDKSVADFDNIIPIPPALVEAEILLICLRDTPCDESILANSNMLIASNIGNQNTLDDLDISAKVVHDESNTHSIDMLRKDRVNYVIYGSNKRYREILEQEFLIKVLKKEPMFHVVNKRHLHLVPHIQKALEEQLILFDSSRR